MYSRLSWTGGRPGDALGRGLPVTYVIHNTYVAPPPIGVGTGAGERERLSWLASLHIFVLALNNEHVQCQWSRRGG